MRWCAGAATKSLKLLSLHPTATKLHFFHIMKAVLDNKSENARKKMITLHDKVFGRLGLRLLLCD